MTDDPAKPPRFPYVAALLCAACIGAAAWMWMRYSWVWEVDLDDPEHLLRRHALTRVRGVLEVHKCFRSSLSRCVIVARTDERVWVYLPRGVWCDGEGDVVSLKGRLAIENLREVFGLGIHGPVLDPMASRFHGASIAGLVVGAMGVFVFTVALRHWMGERRKFREGTEGA
ncbi:MAG: hypothetical protein ACYSU0_13140 [Planctomycetota bacterium]|jgi:hypothetical protein